MQPTAEFKAEAQRAHEKALGLARNKKKATAELAYTLADIDRRKLYEAFGKTDVYSYAVDYGLAGSFRHARELVEMVHNLADKPKLRYAFLQGEIDWTKMRAAGRAATPSTEDRWLEDARKLPTAELEAKAREEKGDPAPVHLNFRMSREEKAEVEQALAAARAIHGRELTDGQAVARVCREWRLMQAGGMTAARSSRNPANRVVISRCSDCGKAWQETRSGRVEVSPESAEAACCDAEFNDVREGPGKLTRSVPPATRRFVLDRHGDRCAVPGCRSVGYLHVHHEPGRKVTGHDRKYLYPACDQHHSMRHRGLLSNTGNADVGFAFFLADGTRVTDPASESSPVAPGAGGTGSPGFPYGGEVSPVQADVENNDVAREGGGGALAERTDSPPEPADMSGSYEQGPAGSQEQGPAGSQEQGPAGSQEQGPAGSQEQGTSGSAEQGTSGSAEQGTAECRAGADVPGKAEPVDPSGNDVLREARLALIALEVRPSEAEDRVRRAYEALTGRREDVTAEALVREALQGGAPAPSTAKRKRSDASRKTGPLKRKRGRKRC